MSADTRHPVARPHAVAATVVVIALLSRGVASPRGLPVLRAKPPPAQATKGVPAGRRWNGPQRAADRAIEREVRRAIRVDPFLLRAAHAVKVTSRGGIVRLVGRVHTAKEWSSIAFKAGQSARGGLVDDRVSIGDGGEGGL